MAAKISKQGRILTALSLALFALPTAGWATELLPGGNIVTIASGTVIKDDCVATGNDVEALGQVTGDLMAMGGTVQVSGPVQGDVMAAGGTVLLRGSVKDDVRAAGGTVLISGPIGDNALLAGGNVTLEPTAGVGRDAVITGNVVRVNSKIGRDLRVNGGDVIINGQVNGNLHAEVGHLTLAPGAVVKGDVILQSNRQPEIAPGARVVGKIDYIPVQPGAASPAGRWPVQEHPAQNGFVNWLIGWAMQFCALLVMGGLSCLLAPSGVQKVDKTLCAEPGGSLLAGLLALLIVPLGAGVIIGTIAGIPAGIALFLLFGAVLLQTGAITALSLGRWLEEHTHHPEGTLLSRLVWGTLTLSLLASLPWIGGLVVFLAVLAGLGALILERGRPLVAGWKMPHQPRTLRHGKSGAVTL